MTFGWQGFSLEHPDEWAPATISGGRKEGYVRIASPNRIAIQIRWQSAKSAIDLPSILSSYLSRLGRDAKAAKRTFSSSQEERDGKVLYQYSSDNCGRGAILQSDKCGRIFFLEAVSTKNDSLLPVFRKLLDGFKCADGDERWSLLGLDLKLPSGLEVESKTLQTGRTQLTLGCKKARIEAQRWGFAEQLIAKHGLEPWARSVLNLPEAKSSVGEMGVEFEKPGTVIRSPIFAIARIQNDQNQLVAVKVSTRDEKWRPRWDWLA